MNWITTNLRLPEDLYMDLKIKAAKERKSVAAVIREKLTIGTKVKNTSILQMMKKLGKEIEEDSKGLNLTKELIKMRYEQ